jgi:hypothetical protein
MPDPDVAIASAFLLVEPNRLSIDDQAIAFALALIANAPFAHARCIAGFTRGRQFLIH